MFSLQEWRALVGPDADGMTDEQLEAHREGYYRLARSVTGLYRDSLRPVGEVGLQQVDYPRRPRRPRGSLKRSA